MYFETKVKHENIDGKLVTEPYLVDAMTCTEAEARITSELSSLYSDLEVVSVKQSKIEEVLFSNVDSYYYLVKVSYPTIDAKTGQEKSAVVATLVQATSLLDAQARFALSMAESVADWEYVSIALTPIIDVFRYETKAE